MIPEKDIPKLVEWLTNGNKGGVFYEHFMPGGTVIYCVGSRTSPDGLRDDLTTAFKAFNERKLPDCKHRWVEKTCYCGELTVCCSKCDIPQGLVSEEVKWKCPQCGAVDDGLTGPVGGDEFFCLDCKKWTKNLR